jgi:hypothetical protein
MAIFVLVICQMEPDGLFLVRRLERRWRWLYRTAVPAIVKSKDLAEEIATRYRLKESDAQKRGVSPRRLRDLSEPKKSGKSPGLPLPAAAWMITQTLHRHLGWSTGPAGLFATGRVADLAGFLAFWWRDFSEKYRVGGEFGFLVMAHDLPFLFGETVFDHVGFLRENYDAMEQRATPDEMDQFHEAMRPLVPEQDDMFRTRQLAAQKAWSSLSGEALNHMDTIWESWTKVKPQELNNNDSRHFRFALAIAKSSNCSLVEQEEFLLRSLSDIRGEDTTKSILGPKPE